MYSDHIQPQAELSDVARKVEVMEVENIEMQHELDDLQARAQHTATVNGLLQVRVDRVDQGLARLWPA